MSMTIQSSVKNKILATPSEMSKVENTPAEMMRDLDQQIEKRANDGCKTNVAIDALKRKERVKPRRVRAMAMTIRYGVRGMMLAAQSKAFKQENVCAEKLYGEAQSGERPQKSCADNRRKPLEFEVGERVMLKVSPWKGVIRFGKKGKLAPRLHVPLDEIKVDKTLSFVEEPVELRVMLLWVPFCGQAKLLAVRYLVKVSWNSKGNFKLIWVWEDYLKDKYPRSIVCSLIPLSHGSFDVIVGMDWLSKRKFVIVCHQKVVRIPLEGDEILQVHGERTQGVVKTLMNTKVEFRIDLVHGATSVAKSPYRLAPLEMQELSEKLRELQDKVLELPRKEKLYAKFTKSKAMKNLGSTYDTIRDMIILRIGRVKLRRVRAMSMTIQSSVKDKILATSSETSKVENAPAEMLRDLDQQMEKRADDGVKAAMSKTFGLLQQPEILE
ncbi:putative reverse transcriptase domain-containing protein [Tanacetum coccineum]